MPRINGEKAKKGNNAPGFGWEDLLPLSKLESRMLTATGWQGLNGYGHKITGSNAIPAPKCCRDTAIFTPPNTHILYPHLRMPLRLLISAPSHPYGQKTTATSTTMPARSPCSQMNTQDPYAWRLPYPRNELNVPPTLDSMFSPPL